MEILIILLMIVGLLAGWIYLMRVEISSFLQRICVSATKQAEASHYHQTTSAVRLVSGSHAVDVKKQIERKNPGSDGGIPQWSIDE